MFNSYSWGRVESSFVRAHTSSRPVVTLNSETGRDAHSQFWELVVAGLQHTWKRLVCIRVKYVVLKSHTKISGGRLKTRDFPDANPVSLTSRSVLCVHVCRLLCVRALG